MKTILLSAVAVLALTAGAAHADSKNFDGFYAGVAVGGAVSSTGIDGVDLYGNGVTAGVYGGYGVTYDEFYFGIEAGGSYSDLDTKIDGATLSKDYGYGIGGRLGYLVTPSTLAYGVVGWERGRFEVSDLPGDVWANGWKFGGGVDQIITDNISLRAELSFVNWDKDDLDGLKSHEIDAKVGLAYHF